MNGPADLFHPDNFAQVLRPLSEAEGLPPWCYTSEAFRAREVQRLFYPNWLVVGRADQIQNSGDYLARQIAGVPVLVIRGRDGEVRAFANTCRHRGARLLSEENGNCRAIKCPYHGWIYGLDGALTGAAGMESAAGFCREDYGLSPIRLESWGGFLFVNIDGRAPEIAAYLGDCPRIHAPWSFEKMVAARRDVFEVACNWKLFIEVFMDYYHLGTVHPSSIASAYGPGDPPDGVQGQFATVFGVNTGTVTVLQGQTRKAFDPVPGLTGRPSQGTRYTLIYPNMILACTTDCMWYFEIDPLAADRTRVAMVNCFPRPTVERSDFQEILSGYAERWDVAMAEDNRVLEEQQRGLTSPFAVPGRLSHLEAVVGIFNTWIATQIIDRPRPVDLNGRRATG